MMNPEDDRAALVATISRLSKCLREALDLVEEYSCKTPVGHIATDCEAVVARGDAALAALPPTTAPQRQERT